MAKPLTCFLVTISHRNEVTRKVVDVNTFTIGRSLDAAVSIVDPNISRNHVKISVVNGRVYIEDLGSANGTFMNDTQLAPQTAVPMNPQDRVNLGMTEVNIQVQVLERIFSKEAIESAVNLGEDDKQKILGLLDGAQNEAERLVRVGREMHDAAIQQSQNEAQKVRAEAELYKNRIEAEWSAKQEKLDKDIADLEVKSKDAILKFEKDSRDKVVKMEAEAKARAESYETRIKAEADKYETEAKAKVDSYTKESHERVQSLEKSADAKLSKLEDEMKIRLAKRQSEVEAALKKKEEDIHLIVQKKQSDCDKEIARILNENEGKGAALLKETQEKVDALLAKAKDDSGLILERTRLRGEEEAQEYFQTVRDETVKQMKDFEESEKAKISSERKRFENERAALLRESEKQLSEFRVEKHRLEKELRIESEGLKANIAANKSELKDLKSLIEKQKKLAADEISYQRDLFEKELKAELDDNRNAMAEYAKQKQLEVEKQMKLREEETDIYIREKTFEFEKNKKTAESKVQELDLKLNQIAPVLEAKMEQLVTYKSQEEMARVTLSELTEKNDNLKDALKSAHTTKNELDKSVKDLESAVKQLANDKSNLEQGIALMKSEYEQKLAVHKSSLANEFELMRKKQNDELNNMRLAEIEQIKRERENAFEDLNRERESISNEILNSIMGEISSPSRAVSKDGLADVLNKKINTTLEDRSLSLVTSYQGDRVDAKGVAVRRAKARRRAILQGMLLGGMALLLFQFAQNKFLEDSNPVQTEMNEKVREREEDLAKRKFNPPQDSELRPTYKDSVIYTKDFARVYESPEFQKKFLKELTIYLLKQWRIDEDKSVEALAVATTLVKALHETKENIHPDFIPDGLKKMEDVEMQSTEQMKEILGTEVRFEAFRKFETKFYQGYVKERLPAAEDGNSGASDL